MKAKRKAISKRVRFAVFARDGYKCRYCGATSEAVQLVIDHLEPVSQGGTNEPENLVTACAPCNAGKSDTKLDAAAIHDDHRLALAQEMQEQRQALLAAKEASAARSKLRDEVLNFYCELRGVERMSVDCLNRYVQMTLQHGPALVFEWMTIAETNLLPSVRDVDFVRYVYGIRRRVMAKQEEAAG
jgi:hypothetical protein